MAALVMPSIARRWMLDAVQAIDTLTDSYAGLFIADITPDADTLVADVIGANEASFGGYARITIDWGTPFVDGSGDGRTISQSLTFDFSGTGAETVYGLFVVLTTGNLGADGVLLLAGRFESPIVLAEGVPSSITRVVQWVQCECVPE